MEINMMILIFLIGLVVGLFFGGLAMFEFLKYLRSQEKDEQPPIKETWM